MTHKRKFGFVNSLIKFITVAPTAMSLFGNFAGMVGAEAHLASRAISQVILLGIFAVTLLTTIWLSLLALLFLFLISLKFSLMMAIAIILLINIFLLIIVVLMLLRAKDHISFPETRHFLHNIIEHNR